MSLTNRQLEVLANATLDEINKVTDPLIEEFKKTEEFEEWVAEECEKRGVPLLLEIKNLSEESNIISDKINVLRTEYREKCEEYNYAYDTLMQAESRVAKDVIAEKFNYIPTLKTIEAEVILHNLGGETGIIDKIVNKFI